MNDKERRNPDADRLRFEPWDGPIPLDLWLAYNDAYGAVVFGLRWDGQTAVQVNKDEALEHAESFLKAMKEWLGGAA